MNKNCANSWRALTAKRFFDVMFSVLGLLAALPLFLMIAFAIKLDSKGPVFFKHQRIGLNGIPFLMYKFRTMVASAASIGPGITYHEDTRITALGQLLRKTKLDELPQMINVWRGEMSFVGPRPEVPNYVKHYSPEQVHVLTAKPGITGPAQIEWRDEASYIRDVEKIDEVYVQQIMPKKLVLDLEYVKSPISLMKDVQYILTTVRTLLS
ncbi:MAG: sugar transferase [Candidatus Poribacteria bacterium]|nr:sugar transferase [Candidatus Poribacteria bacterium]